MGLIACTLLLTKSHIFSTKGVTHLRKLLILLFIFLPYISLANTQPTISGKNAIAIETSSGRILYEKNAFTKANIASTTKIMTAIVVLENTPDLEVDLTEGRHSVTVSQYWCRGILLAFEAE